MFILRVVALLCLAALLVNLGFFVVTRDRRYLRWAWKVAQYTIAFAVIVLALFVFERLLIAV